MRNLLRTLLTLMLALGLLAGCGDDGDGDADVTTDDLEDVGDDLRDVANDAWASLRTNAERLIDKAATGDDEARDELLAQCRDSLQELRKAEDPGADRLQSLCDEIRDADDDTAWDEVRREIEEMGDGS
ncbi:MAG TPA: hypothetical protein VMN58_01655 [Acidimicrobiales bacterium]|nr:hypothetical protein [Acidimicrobiales bacterium]